MNIIDKIRELEKNKSALQREHDKLLPKYTEIESKYLKVSEELDTVIGTLNKVRTMVAKTLNIDESEIQMDSSVSRTFSLRDEIVSFLKDNPHSTSRKVSKELNYPNASRYLSQLVLNNDDKIQRVKARDDGPWLYFTSSVRAAA